MRTRYGRLLALVLLAMVFAPQAARAQLLGMPETNLPLPFGGERYRRDGTGLFLALEIIFMEQSIELSGQPLAFRGFIDMDGSISGSAPGTFVGTRIKALDVGQLRGPDSYQPGLNMAMGWRFNDGTAIEVGWWHLTDTRLSASANVVPPNFTLGANLAETFVTAPVFNFPLTYAGQAQNVNVGNVGATFGIWNAASEMSIDLVQRFDQGYVNLRVPVDQGDNYRIYGTVGGKAIIMWERFKWRTVSRGVNGGATPLDVGLYSNTVSNRLYGATVGCAYDWYLGSSPVGAFALTAELQGSLMIDIAKERAKYELGDFSTAASRAINEFTLAPTVQADISIWWYPYEGIQFRLGYHALAMFNTVAARQPVDFNLSGVSPNWERGVTRFLRGIHIGGGFVF